MILFRQKVAIPDFLEAQRKSFRLFLETGIRRELEFISPIMEISVRIQVSDKMTVIFLYLF